MAALPKRDYLHRGTLLLGAGLAAWIHQTISSTPIAHLGFARPSPVTPISKKHPINSLKKPRTKTLTDFEGFVQLGFLQWAQNYTTVRVRRSPDQPMFRFDLSKKAPGRNSDDFPGSILLLLSPASRVLPFLGLTLPLTSWTMSSSTTPGVRGAGEMVPPPTGQSLRPLPELQPKFKQEWRHGAGLRFPLTHSTEDEA